MGVFYSRFIQKIRGRFFLFKLPALAEMYRQGDKSVLQPLLETLSMRDFFSRSLDL